MRHWLDSRSPDIVALQELKTAEEDLPADVLSSHGYEVASHCQTGWNGVAVLSKRPILTSESGMGRGPDAGARVLTTRHDGLSVVSVYVPNGKTTRHPDYQMKLEWLDAFAEFIESQFSPDEPLVVGGDFNVVPGPLDSWDEERMAGAIHHTEAERDRVRRLLNWGLTDVFRNRHPDEAKFSWWDYRAGAFHRGHGLRIDLLLATVPVADQVNAITIDRDYRKKKEGLIASDHAPVYMDVGGEGADA